MKTARFLLFLILSSGLISGLKAQSASAGTAPHPGPESLTDPKEIVRRSVEVDHHSWELARNYTCQRREVEKHLDKKGGVKSQEIKTHDITFYYDEPYERLVQINDQPLSAKEEQKEEDKLNKFLAKRRNESEDDRRKRLEKQEKERREQRAFLRDMENAYDFRLLGEEPAAGVDSYVIEATPRKDFHPTQPHAGILSKFKGKLWIDKREYHWVKAEAEAIDTVSFGLFLARIHKGSHFNFEQTRVNDEVWLMRRFFLNFSARFLLVDNEGLEQEDIFSNYKKFTTSIRILPGVAEAPPDPAQQKPGPPK